MANPPVVRGGRGCRALFGLTRRLSRWADAGALARGPHAPAPRRHRLRANPRSPGPFHGWRRRPRARRPSLAVIMSDVCAAGVRGGRDAGLHGAPAMSCFETVLSESAAAGLLNQLQRSTSQNVTIVLRRPAAGRR